VAGRVAQAARAVRGARCGRLRGARNDANPAEPRKPVHQADRQGTPGVTMPMRALWNAADKDLRRQLRDPLSLVLGLGLPLVIGGLMALVMGGYSGPAPTIHLLVADEDGGVLGGLLTRALGRGQPGQGQGLRIEEVGRDAGRTRIAGGEATALLVIPKG